MTGNVATAKLPARGLVCPACRGPSRVVQTYRPCAGLVTRSRECLRCKRRFMTDERVRLSKHVPAALPRPIEVRPAA